MDLDYFKHPAGYYRAYHLIIEKDKKPVEVQLHTPQTARLQEWGHDAVYKGMAHIAPEQRSRILGYAQKISDAIVGKGAMPPCTDEIKQLVGCL